MAVGGVTIVDHITSLRDRGKP